MVKNFWKGMTSNHSRTAKVRPHGWLWGKGSREDNSTREWMAILYKSFLYTCTYIYIKPPEIPSVYPFNNKINCACNVGIWFPNEGFVFQIYGIWLVQTSKTDGFPHTVSSCKESIFWEGNGNFSLAESQIARKPPNAGRGADHGSRRTWTLTNFLPPC